jgi:adenosylcobyric acid synthase
MGETEYAPGAEIFAELTLMDETTCRDGAVGSSEKIAGTYVHGIFDDDAFRHRFLACVRDACDLAPARRYACVTAERQSRIDRWADHLRNSLDLKLIHQMVRDSP